MKILKTNTRNIVLTVGDLLKSDIIPVSVDFGYRFIAPLYSSRLNGTYSSLTPEKPSYQKMVFEYTGKAFLVKGVLVEEYVLVEVE